MDDFRNISDVSLEQYGLVEAVKDRLLIALLRKVGGTFAVSRSELNAALQFDLAFKLTGDVLTFAAMRPKDHS